MSSMIELIKILRERTGAGMMDCKTALVECNNDVDRACDWLREKGITKAAKKADRIAAEGLVAIRYCEKCNRAVISEVNCETDFVAKADPFIELVDEINHTILHDSIKDLDTAIETTKPLFTDATVKLGEKMNLRRFEVIEGTETQSIGTYIHNGGKIGTVVVLENKDEELAKFLAMHIAANAPRFITEAEIPAEEIENETKVQLEACKNDEKLAGKPEAALKQIVKGKVHKVFSEVILNEQKFLLDPSKTVAQAVAEKKNSIVKFVRYQVGEGLEKRVDNFAEEVAKQSK